MRVSSRGPWLRSLTAVLCSATVLVVAGSPAVALADETTVVGELVQTWPAGDPALPTRHMADGPVSWVRTDDGETVRIATDDVAHVAVGSGVEAVLGAEVAEGDYGLEPARAADVTVLEAASNDGSLTPASGPVTNEVTVVGVLPTGATTPFPSDTQVSDVVDVVNGVAHDYWAEQSDGAIELHATGSATWVPTVAPCSDPLALWTEAAASVGFVPADGQHLMLLVGTRGLGSWPCEWGMAELGTGRDYGGMSYVRGADHQLIAKQLGHNFGLGESWAASCEWGGCPTSSAGDWYDPMAYQGTLGSLNVALANRLGVLPDSAVQVADTWGSTVGRTYTLQPLGGRTGVLGLKLFDNGRTYWLEYRTSVGRDAWLATGSNWRGLQTGVLVHAADHLWGDSVLLDGTPTSSADPQVALPVGQRIRIGGADITVESVTPTGATVRVAAEGMAGYPGGSRDCARRPVVPMTGVAVLMTDASAGAFVTGLDRGLWYRPLDGAANSWQSLGGGLHYGPSAVAAGSTSYVFVTGLTGELWYRANSGGGWGPWTGLGGYLTASPAAVSLGTGHVRVFGRGMQGELWSRELNGGSWSGWTPHGGYLSGPPTATARPEERTTQVHVRGSDGYTYRQTLPVGSGAQPYEHLDFMSCTAVAMDQVSVDSDLALGAWVDPYGTPRLLQSTGSQWLGGVITSTPAVAYGSEEFVFVGRGTDNALWFFDGRAGGSGWRSLGGYVL